MTSRVFSNLVVGEQIWKVVFFLLSASWMQDFAASMFFDWNYVKCSDCMGTEDSHRVTFLDVLNVAFSWERAFYVSHLSKEVSESVLPCYRVSSALTSTVTAKNSHCKELPLQRTATAKKNRCKEESLQRRVTAKNTRCKEESPQRTVTVKNSHCKEQSLQRTVTVKNSHCKEQSLWRTATAKNSPCKDQSL